MLSMVSREWQKNCLLLNNTMLALKFLKHGLSKSRFMGGGRSLALECNLFAKLRVLDALLLRIVLPSMTTFC